MNIFAAICFCHSECVFVFSPKEESKSSTGQDLECIKFFSFSLIDGYISLVMDTEAQRR